MLALWQYDWTESDWTGVTPSDSTIASDPFFGLLLALQWDGTTSTVPVDTGSRSNAGGGKKRNNHLGADPDFWDVRERYLRRFVKPEVIKALPALLQPRPAPVPVPQPVTFDPLEDTSTPFILQQQALAAALQRAVNAQNATELMDAAQRAHKIALDIQKIHQQYYERAIAILLLDVS